MVPKIPTYQVLLGGLRLLGHTVFMWWGGRAKFGWS